MPNKVSGESKQVLKEAEILQEYYSKALLEKGNKYKELFFYHFPSTFQAFNQIYGYSNTSDSVYALHTKSYDHYTLFMSLDSIIMKETYLNKLIKLGIDGYWAADGVGMLQNHLNEYLTKNLPQSISILEKYSPKEIRSFWFFLFDGPAPAKTIPLDIDKVRSLNSSIADLAEDAFKQVRKEAKSSH